MARARFATNFALAVAATSVIGLATFRVHVRVQATLAGYDIGKLRNEEAKLLEERAFLRMQLAKLTTKKHLMLMTENEEEAAPGDRTYALK